MMRIQVINDYHRQRFEVYAYTLRNTGREYIFPGEDGRTMYQVVEADYLPDGKEIKPLITLPHHLGMELLEQLVDYATNEGISATEQSNNAGKLSATEKHNDFLQSNLTKMIDHLTFRKP